jgi:hypothetical protein
MKILRLMKIQIWLNALWYPELNPRTEKGICGEAGGEIWI